jgi:hypothetical protein
MNDNQSHLTRGQFLMAIALVVMLFASAFLDAGATEERRLYLPVVMVPPQMSSIGPIVMPIEATPEAP